MSRAPALCPYVGLAPYTLAERDYFFGRERECKLVAANMRAAPLCVFYGASGVGKSSVLMAGAIPELEQRPRTAVVVYREWQHENLTERIRDEAVNALVRARKKLGSEATELDAYLARAPREPAPALDKLLADACAALRGQLLVVFDQFEEYALYHTASADPSSFDAQLARAVNRDDISASVLLSLREDQLASLDRFRARIPNLFTNTIRLEAMDESAARLALAGPLARYRERFPDDPVSIEDALVSDVIAQVASGRVSIEERGSGVGQADPRQGRIEAPFLQLVMTRLWSEEAERGSPVLRAATLAELGGATGIVKGHLDRVLAGLSEDQRDLCSRFFDRLVTPSGSKIAYRVDDLATTAEASREEVAEVIRQLVGDRRVLRNVAAGPGEAGSERVEIFHDVLAGAVLDWQRRFGDVRKQATLRLQAIRRATRIAVPLLGVLLAVAVGLASVAFQAQQNADIAEVSAKQAEGRAEAAQLATLAAELDLKRTNALVAEASGALESARNALEQVRPASTAQANTAQNAINQIDEVLRPRIYFQGFSPEQRDQMKAVAGSLEKAGFAVPGFEFVKSGPRRTELRYFRDEDKQWADKAIAALQDAGFRDIELTPATGFDTSKLRPGHLEVWFGMRAGAKAKY